MKVIDRSPIKLWFEDESFLPIMEAIIEATKVEIPSCYMLYQFATNAKNIDGDVAEVGTYKGGSAKLLSLIFNDGKKDIHLFDTFQGMPAVDKSIDYFQQGSFSDTSLVAVKEYLSEFSNVNYHPGFFPQTAIPVNSRKFCFVHIDVDILQSARDCCEFFFPRLSIGGIMIFDDYGYRKCPGAKKAVDEYFQNENVMPIYLPTGQCVIIKNN
ncbi:MAG: TylF/MycF/NovP-related O-methyltransferase [Bacteroidota bacterium]